MKTLKTIAIAASTLTSLFLATSAAQADDIETAGQAMSLCKSQAEAAHPGYKMSKSTKIRQKRGVFKITLKVVTETEKFKTFCEVARDGTVTYAKA